MFRSFHSIPERGKAREEYYFGTSKPKEQFGLHKRTRRVKRGIFCSLPNGKFPSKENA